MENASKALIIAGSVLIALIVLSLGVIVFNRMANSNLVREDLTEQEIGNFNSQFTKYAGESVAGSQVNDLIQLVISVNISSKNENRPNGDRYVTINFPNISGESATITGNSENGVVYAQNQLNKVKSNIMYKVELTYINGLVSIINVKSN